MHEVEIELEVYQKALKFVTHAAEELKVPNYEDDNGDPIPWKDLIRKKADRHGARFDTEDRFKVQISYNTEIESPKDKDWIQINGLEGSREHMGEMMLIGRDHSDGNLFVVSEEHGETGLEKLSKRDASVSRLHCMLIKGNGYVEIFKLVDKEFDYQIGYSGSF